MLLPKTYVTEQKRTIPSGIIGFRLSALGFQKNFLEKFF